LKANVWPVGDKAWVTRYRAAMSAKHVPAQVLEERERELLDAAHGADLSAAELFGDAEALASEDAAELATTDEAVRTSLGGGLRPALREVGGALIGIGVVAVAATVVRHGWFVDIDIAHVLVAWSVLVAFLGWIIGRAFLSAGRPVPAIGALIVVAVVFAASIVSAATLGSGHIAASNVPVPLLALVLLAPGVIALVAGNRTPQPVLREGWNDDEWLRRLHSGLRTSLVPAATAREHIAEIEHVVRATPTSAFAEYGHPLVLARELAAADRTARARRWWVSTIAGTGTPLVIAALILINHSWGALTIPLAGLVVIAAAIALRAGWSDRPWAAKKR
jgi:hypothetical protein